VSLGAQGPSRRTGPYQFLFPGSMKLWLLRGEIVPSTPAAVNVSARADIMTSGDSILPREQVLGMTCGDARRSASDVEERSRIPFVSNRGGHGPRGMAVPTGPSLPGLWHNVGMSGPGFSPRGAGRSNSAARTVWRVCPSMTRIVGVPGPYLRNLVDDGLRRFLRPSSNVAGETSQRARR